MSSEVSGYLQIIIGLVGIVLTLINVRKLIPEVDLFTKTRGAPPGLDNFSGFLRTFIVISLLGIMLFLLGMGFSVTLSAAYYSLGAKYPLLASSMTMITLLVGAITLTMSLYRYRFWVAGFVGSVGAGIAALVAAVNADISTFWSTVIVSLVIFALTGFGTLITYLE